MSLCELSSLVKYFVLAVGEIFFALHSELQHGKYTNWFIVEYKDRKKSVLNSILKPVAVIFEIRVHLKFKDLQNVGC